MHVQEPDDVAQVRAAVLVPALLGAQRQLPEERAGHADPVRARRRRAGGRRARRHADHACRASCSSPRSSSCRRSAASWPTATTRRSSPSASGCARSPSPGSAATGFFLHSVPVLFVALGLFGVVAALFGPVKYGILPEKLRDGRAVRPATRWLKAQRSWPSSSAPSPAASRWPRQEARRSSSASSSPWHSPPGRSRRSSRPPDPPRRASPSRPIRGSRRWRCCASCKTDRRAVGRRADRVVVLAGRLRGAVAAAGPDQDAHRRQRRRGDHVPGRLHGRHRRRLGAGGAGQPRPAEPGARAAGRAADGRCSRSASPAIASMLAPGAAADRPGRGARLGHRAGVARLPLRPRGRRRPLHRARRSRPCSRGRRWTGARA